jgi:hypothetical protein
MTIQPTGPVEAVSQVAAAKPEQAAPVAGPAVEEAAKKAQPDNLYEDQGKNYDLSV